MMKIKLFETPKKGTLEKKVNAFLEEKSGAQVRDIKILVDLKAEPDGGGIVPTYLAMIIYEDEV